LSQYLTQKSLNKFDSSEQSKHLEGIGTGQILGSRSGNHQPTTAKLWISHRYCRHPKYLPKAQLCPRASAWRFML